MENPFFVALFAFLFGGSLAFFIPLYLKTRNREISAVKKFEETRRQMQEQITEMDSLASLLNSVHEVGFDNSAAETKSAIAKMVLNFACKIMKCSVGSLMMIDKETNELTIVAANGISDHSALFSRLKVGEGIAGRVSESGKLVIVDNIDTDARFLKRNDVEYRFKSLIAVPIKVKNKVIGVVNLHALEPFHPFNERDIQLLNILADQSALTIENWNLHENLQNFYFEMIETLARALELKEKVAKSEDAYKQMRLYARLISKALNLPESIVKQIEFASVMNGIGKMGIDDSILRKPGKLTPEEYDQMKKHPEIGKQMISQVQFLSPVTPMILYHQERWDGKGYPAGLKGEEIPLGSRIVAVINAYQAMRTDRPYRNALSESEAMEELKRGAGTQFDPKVVEAFIKILEKGNQSEHQKISEPRTDQGPEQQKNSEQLRKWI